MVKNAKDGIKESLKLLLSLLIPVMCELIFQWEYFPEAGAWTGYKIYAGVIFGGLIWMMTGCFRGLTRKILFCVLHSAVCIYFGVQLVYYRVFLVFFSFVSVGAVGLDALQFKDQIFSSIRGNAGSIALMLGVLFCACVTYCLLDRKKTGRVQERAVAWHVVGFSAWLLVALAYEPVLYAGGSEEMSAYAIYHQDWDEESGAERLGIFAVATRDVMQMMAPGRSGNEQGGLVIIDRPGLATPTPSPMPTPTSTPTPTPSPTPDATPTPEPTLPPNVTATPTPTPTNTPTPTPTNTPTPTPIDTSPNVLNIDFAALAAAESDPAIKELHQYFASEEFTRKNEYTGMFEGYNLIMITAEGFAPYAMHEELTPTLNMMASEGFVFNNYYAPLWRTSTIDGEFVNCTGLLPDGTYSLRRMIEHDLRFCFGNVFSKLGYCAYAYHNHTDDYYDRDKTHPAMGYIYKGREGIGMSKRSNGKYPWPESDLEMMEKTVSEYIGKEPFHAYYMTVSGHTNYTRNGNAMAYKHWNLVKDLPYENEESKAYLACNYELELAMKYLIEQLEAAGVADRTVIVIATDHYPYGLVLDDEGEERDAYAAINELVGHTVEKTFELYKSSLIIWSPSMTEPVEVDKVCMSIDIVPTLSNLFGLEYDSRLYIGKDILSDSEGLVMFRNQKTFITDKLMYNGNNGKITYLTDEKLPENYLSTMKQIVKNRFYVSKKIIDLDYYSYLPE